MKTLKRAVWLSLAVLVGAGDARPQQPGQVVAPQPARPTPTRDPKPIVKGTAVVKGQLLDALTGNPIRRARVTLFGPGSPNGAGAQTDAEGRFEIRELPAGKYTFSTTAPGYLSLNLSNGGKPLPPLEVATGAAIEKVVLRLMKGGVIAGHVLDEFGDPILAADVQALRYRYVDGRRELSPVGSFFMTARTDDLGAYRIYGLDPGDYYISARTRTDLFGTAIPNTEGQAPTFYPGTANAGEARRVPVRAGRETLGIVFPMVVMRLASIHGRAVTSAGEPLAGGSITVTQRSDSGGTTGSSRTVRPDGSFEIGGLPAGSYLLTTSLNNVREEDPGEMGRLLVSVIGEDLNDVLLVGQTGGTARGRVVTDEGIAPPFAPGTMQLRVSPTDLRLPAPSRPAIRPRDDWTFEFKGLFDRMHVRPGGFSTGPTPAASMWTFKSILLDGRDVTDSGIEFRPGQTVENIEMVYTRKVSRLSGTVRTEQGSSTDAYVVLFPADESRWMPQSRWIRTARPRDDGQYTMTPGPVPSDDYLIVAVTDLETGQWADPEFLKSLKDLATRVSIGEGETKVQDLKIVEWRK